MRSRTHTQAKSKIERQGEAQMSKQGRGAGRVARLTMALTAAIAALAMSAPLAQAAFEVTGFENDVVNADGSTAAQAGGHPYSVSANVSFSEIQGPGYRLPDESIRNVSVDLPAGFVGSTTAVLKCSTEDLFGVTTRSVCPLGSQVGMLEVEGVLLGSFQTEISPLYNVEAPPGVPASFGANVLGTLVYLDTSIRSDSDYGVTVKARNTSQTMPIVRTKATFWGVPADSSHDIQRCLFPTFNLGVCDNTWQGPDPHYNNPNPAGIAAKALLTNLSNCDGQPFVTKLWAESWAGSTDSATHTLEEGGNPVAVKGCDKVPFEPKMSVVAESREAGAPTGIEAKISIPPGGLENPTGIAQSPLRSAKVVFPQGMTVNASSSDGLTGCSEAQAKLGTKDPAVCPDASKLGTVNIKTPLLENPLEGSVYLATQGTNPFKSLIALYVSVADPVTGIVIKLPGKVSPDPSTGQLTATFEDTPQLPFSEFTMKLKGGNRAALVTPSTCGTYVTEASLAGWANPGSPVSVPSSFKIDQGCGKKDGFTPGFEAGTTNPIAGRHSAFTMRVTRPDGQQNLASIETTLPEGLSAKLAGVPLCPDAQAGNGNCPSGSQIGTTTVGAGAGTNPLYVPQPGKPATAVYLAGPYKGAPYSIIAKVPAQAGPFDLGTVTVRNALEVDPTNAQVTAVSDPLPQILQGIPIAYRDVRIEVNRPEFTLNPTSCKPASVKGAIGSSQGAKADVSDRFSVSDCAALAFKPSLTLKVSGGTKRGKYTKLKAELKAAKGQANIGKASVALPHSIFLAQEHIRTICTRVQYAANNCPQGSIYGKAKAITPLLDKPLEGPVYLRSSNNPLPDLVASLDGQIHIDLVGRIDSVNGGIRTTFEGVPDAPVSSFTMEMKGGKKSLLVNSTNLCKKANRATVKLDGQNGKVHDFSPLVQNSCGKKAKKRGGGKRK